jgi:EmrB/QacA subfamily drug resistance transporter
VLTSLSLAGLSFALLQSMVAPALPAMARDFESSGGDVAWVMTVYLLVASVATPIAGRLGDMFGKRRLTLVSLACLAIGSVISALAPTMGLLITGRALQGAAGAVVPLSIAIIRDELPRAKVSMAVALMSALFGIGGGVGIVVGGPIVDQLSWQWLFWIPLILTVLAIVGVALAIPESRVRTPGRVDAAGALLLSGGIAPILLAVSKGQAWGWTSVTTLGLLAAGVVALVLCVVVELRVREPLLDMRTMALRGVWTTNVVGLAFGFLMFGMFVLVPQLLQMPESSGYGFGMSATSAGLFLLPAAVAMVVAGLLAGALESTLGPKRSLILAAAISAIAFAVPAIGHGSTTSLILLALLCGAGVGFAFAAMSHAIIAAVPANQTGVATSMNAISRTMGGALGTAILAQVLTSRVDGAGTPLDSGFTTGFWVCVAVAVVALLAAAVLPARRATAH